MKSKKLFAILTLMMFAMTLLPMAAFGATYSAGQSEVKGSNTSVNVYDDTSDNLAKITVTFKDSTGAVANKKVSFWLQADTDAAEGYVQSKVSGADDAANYYKKIDGGYNPAGGGMANEDGYAVQEVWTDSNGRVFVYVGSRATGTFKVSVYNDEADRGLLIGSVTVTVGVGDGNVDLVAINDDDKDHDTYADAVKTGDTDDEDPYLVNAGDGVELRAWVHDGNSDIEGKTVTFQAKYENGSWYTIGTDVSDEDGYAYYYFEESKTGNYAYRAKISDEESGRSGVLYIKVRPQTLKTIELKTADGTNVAKGSAADLDFYVKDKYGNLIKSGLTTGDFEVKVESAPSDSKFDDSDWTASISGDLALNSAKLSDGIIRVKFTADKEGDYLLKIREQSDAVSRISASINVTAVKFGDAVSLKPSVKNIYGETVTTLTRSYSTEANTQGGQETNYWAGELSVKKVNAAGVEVTAPASTLQFASSDVTKVAVNDDGKILIKSGADGLYTITIYYDDNNVVGTAQVNVVGPPVALQATPTVSGKTATVALQYIDKNGNATYVNPQPDDLEDGGFDATYANAKDNYAKEGFTVSVPSGVTASNLSYIGKTGAGSFELTASEYGKYSVVVLTNNKKIAKTLEVEFIMPDSEKPVIGSKNVTMFIGATGYVQDGVAKVMDVAPFIQDSRTFVAVRYIAEAFGAEVGWNEATQTVTLSRSDMTVTIVIGSNVITVVKDGVTTTVEADVAAFIKDGRTVLPFRAVGEAFGATVEYDAATQAVSYQQ